ncbi:ankyrin repeat-containing protein [Fusarium denticulatum]|uniref:Ankyrin repeat-containing protein n=1 Tax=Fusarium denticulatum TaxID=48507 RepID=A0A8H5TRH6_9HYPO|nr:ankyrin repeat-containing protein [Fusarium denticulatum]
MATVPELFVAIFATASIVLLATILHQRSLRQPLMPPATQTLTRRVDDTPTETLAPKTKKSLTLCINEIPADHIEKLDRNLESILGKILDPRGDANPMVRRSLVSHGKDSLCATVSIKTSLSADDLSAQLCQAGQAHPYKYTCKFTGVTPLYEDKNGADIDIIAVPGLESHALGSWKSPNSDDVWLRDFLPKDVPNIRVLLYGYDTSLQGSLSKQSMEELGGGFLEKIIAFRANDGTNRRPIVFIGHSLGGLLIKEALIRARKHRSHNDSDSGLVKYESRSQDDYTIVRERLRRLVDKARLEVAKRFAEHSLSQPLSQTMKACLKSLAFEDMDGRQVKIDDAAEGTCQWLLEHKTLIEWKSRHRGLLWIKGKPGSGKSTLMKYAKDALPPIYGTDTLCVPGAVADLIEYFEDKRTTEGEPGEKWQWHLQPLQDFLKLSLTNILSSFPVILFIDALDECGEQPAVELIEHLKHLLSSLPSADSRFGIFFSCRHYPILELDGGLTVLLDMENNADITTYVQDRFSAGPDHYIESLISGRAQGVFMWAHLVVERVLRMKRRREPRVEIEAAITQTPQNLDELYRGLIQGVEDRSVTLKLMQWICFSTRPLTANELRWAMAVDPDQAYQSLDECKGSKHFINDDDINTRVMVLSCGLAEIVPSNNGRIVQFIHQSVKDFFVNGGLMALDITTEATSLVIPAVHCRLSRSCIRCFRMVVLSQSGSLSWKDKSRFPLLHYATTSWVSHMKLGDPAEVSPNDLLHLLGWPTESLVESWVRMYQALKHYRDKCPTSGSNLVHVVARHGLTNLLSCLLLDTGNVGVDARDTKNSQTPLLLASRNGHEAVVKMLLDIGKVNIDARDKGGQTPLSCAAENGHEVVVEMLLDTGKVDVDARDKGGRTLLWLASRNRHKAMVKMPLNTGKVDADVEDFYDLTAY